MAAAVIERLELVPKASDEQSITDRAKAHLSDHSDALQDLRLQALSRFEALGLPTRRLEAWKYINLRPLLAQNLSANQASAELQQSAVKAHWLADKDVIRLVFVNGKWNEALSSTQANTWVERLQDVCQNDPAQVRSLLGLDLEQEQDAFVALNTALFQNGAYVAIPDDTEIDPLVQVLFVTTTSEAAETHLRNVFVLGKNAKARFVIQHVGLSNANYFNNSFNQFALDEGAQAECTLVLAEGKNAWHLASSRARLQTHAQLTLNTMTLGGLVNRHSINGLVQGEKAELHLNGLDVLDGKTEIYHHTVTEHWVPNAISDQTYKGILDESSKSEFNSLVFVAKGADGTDSHQLHKTLLLSDDAHVWTRPQLQINADDVKCAHGSAVGQLAEDQLFYLASRGLSQGLAKSLLTYGFAEDVIQKISDPLVKNYLTSRVLDNLHGACAVFKKELGA